MCRRRVSYINHWWRLEQVRVLQVKNERVLACFFTRPRYFNSIVTEVYVSIMLFTGHLLKMSVTFCSLDCLFHFVYPGGSYKDRTWNMNETVEHWCYVQMLEESNILSLSIFGCCVHDPACFIFCFNWSSKGLLSIGFWYTFWG